MKRTIGILSLVALAIGISTSCSKKNDTSLPPIGGYNTSDEIAATNNIAKWSFDGNLTESKQSLAGVGTNTAFGTGKKGQAWQGSSTQPRYAIYPAGTGVPALSSYSFAFWLNSDSMKTALANPTQGHGAQGIFAYANPADFWGGINLFIENRGDKDADTLRVKLLIQNKRAGVVWQGQGPIVRVPGALNRWVHIVLTYDDASSLFSAYVDGVVASKLEGVPYQDQAPNSSPSGFLGYSYTQYADNPNGFTSTTAPKYGALALPAGSQMVIGSHQFTTTPALNTGGTQQPWATTFAGQLDEFRIYNKALSSSEINSLFQLESAGR